jgi:ribosomal protein L33
MAQRKKSIRKKGNRVTIRVCNDEGGKPYCYTTKINKQNQKMNETGKLKLRKWHPVLRKVVWFLEKKMPPHSK